MFLGTFEEMQLRYEFIDARKSDECGCPEEDWIINLLFVTMHLEPDNSGHIFIDCGDWDDEKLVECNSIEELRVKAAEWANSIPIDNEL
jgi:hypothetical protein